MGTTGSASVALNPTKVCGGGVLTDSAAVLPRGRLVWWVSLPATVKASVVLFDCFTAAPTPAPVAVAAVHVVPVIHAIPVQYVQVAHVPVQHQNVQFYSGNIGHCQYAAVGVSRSGEQEVVGIDGARYTLKKIE